MVRLTVLQCSIDKHPVHSTEERVNRLGLAKVLDRERDKPVDMSCHQHTVTERNSDNLATVYPTLSIRLIINSNSLLYVFFRLEGTLCSTMRYAL